MSTPEVGAALVTEARGTFLKVSLLLLLALPAGTFWVGSQYVSRSEATKVIESEHDRIRREERIVQAQERTASALESTVKAIEHIERDTRDIQQKISNINTELQGRRGK